MTKSGMILKGELSMQGQPTEVIQTAIAATRDLSEQIAKDINLVQPETVNLAATGLGQLGLAANQLSPGEGENAHINLAKALARQSTWQALDAMIANPRYNEQGLRVAQVVRSGAATGLKSLETLAATKLSNGYKLSFNKTTGRYEVKGPAPRSVAGFTPTSSVAGFSTVGPAVSPRATEIEDAANRYLSLLVATEKHSLEPVKGTPLQIREFHALGTVPEGAKKTKSAAKSADEQTDEMIGKLTEAIQRLPQGLASQSELEARNVPDINQKEFGPLIKDTASRYNVPLNVVTALLSVENAGLDPNAKGPVITKGSHKGDRAAGLFQIMEKTAQGLGIDRNSVEGNIEGGIKLLAENFARTGNWRDAIAMYHSGVTFDEAKDRTDGGMKTVDYVARILQRAGLS
jgi:hypothetical protein